ncbi:cullin family protein [Aspergillus stella-maris]|uniref:cullin family protein n=1 Tax=Aspergillus stella-maris TaxID=1810926 RepID=UPI003CCDE1EA
MALRARQKIRAPRRGFGAAGTDGFETNWKDLSSSLTRIHTKDASDLSFEQLYRNSYNIVLVQRGDDLYERTKTLEKEWLCGEVQKRVAAGISPSLLLAKDAVDLQDQATERRAAGEKFLSVLKDVWEDHQLCMQMITDVLMYMDRVVAGRKVSIYAAAMALFRDHVLRSSVPSDDKMTVADVLKSTVLFMIQLERSGHMIDRPLIRHCIYMLEGLYETEAEEESSKLYLTSFEPDYIETSTVFYEAEGKRLLETADAATFCAVAFDRIAEEKERCLYTVSHLSETKIKDVLDNELIRKNLAEVINFEGTGVRVMLDQDRTDTLGRIYTLSARVDPKKPHLVEAVQKRIVEMGQEINTASIALASAPAPSKSSKPSAEPKDKKEKDKEKEKEKPVNQVTSSAIKWVDDILALKKKFDDIWNKAFQSDQVLQSAITASFSSFINSTARSSEFLSLFFDENLKKGIKGKTDNEVDALLENGITLLRYVKDKDLFEAYYKKHLSRRLLMKRSLSMDIERQMISKMKMEVGNQFTQRLEAMFRDMTISEDLTSSYKQYVQQMGDPDQKRLDLDINVLTSTMWPMEIMSNTRDGHVELPCNYPKEVETVKQSFQKFYLEKHSGRKLSWQPTMGTADIRATFHKSNGKTQRHELNVSTYAMIVLLLFNDVPAGESLTYEEIQARTNIPDNDLIRNLQSLAVAPKTRVLKKDPMSKDVKPTDKFFFNNDFSSPFMKVRIGVVSGSANKVENQDQRKETEKKMNEERGASIEAAVVRIMKQRKKLIHSNLISEVLSQLSARFVPDVNMIKKRIESLIDREYLERISEDPPEYGYVA